MHTLSRSTTFDSTANTPHADQLHLLCLGLNQACEPRMVHCHELLKGTAPETERRSALQYNTQQQLRHNPLRAAAVPQQRCINVSHINKLQLQLLKHNPTTNCPAFAAAHTQS